MLTQTIRILAGDHDPPHPFVVVDNFGLHVDLSKVHGQLWDPTVEEIIWGHRAVDGRIFGTVRLKNGDQPRAFWDPELMLPYLRAWTLRKADEDLKAELVKQDRKDKAEAAAAEALRRDALDRAVREINDPVLVDELKGLLGA
jgi:hypothetical protein